MTVLSREGFELLADLVEGEVREGYSGRGMYGDTCPAIVVESAPDLIQFGVALTEALVMNASDIYEINDFVDMAKDIAKSARTDSMGLGTIVYFPRLSLE